MKTPTAILLDTAPGNISSRLRLYGTGTLGQFAIGGDPTADAPPLDLLPDGFEMLPAEWCLARLRGANKEEVIYAANGGPIRTRDTSATERKTEHLQFWKDGLSDFVDTMNGRAMQSFSFP